MLRKNLSKFYDRRLLALMVTGLLLLFNIQSAGAAALNTASVTLGSGLPSATTSYTFQASNFTQSAVKCIQFVFNTQYNMSGSVPTGFSSTSSTLSSSSVITAANWTIGNSTNGTVNLTDSSGATPAASGNIVLGNITNGSTAGTPYYLQVNTYTDTGCSASQDTVTVGLIYNAGQAVSVTVPPSLGFSVAGVSSSTTVNGATTNFATTASTIPFGSTATIGTNAIGAQALTVTTNSGNGYTTGVNYTGSLSNGTHSFTNWSGTNTSPTTFSSAGTEAFGYTTSDVLSPLTQFSSNKWAGLSTTPQIVMSNSTAPSGGTQTYDVGYQIGLSNSTPPGSYSTTVVYTLTPLY